jgi:hypothetical protein
MVAMSKKLTIKTLMQLLATELVSNEKGSI